MCIGLGVWWLIKNVRFGPAKYVYLIDSDGNESIVEVRNNDK